MSLGYRQALAERDRLRAENALLKAEVARLELALEHAVVVVDTDEARAEAAAPAIDST